MPVDIVSIEFFDKDFLTANVGVDYLSGSIGDKLTAEIVFDVHWETLEGIIGKVRTLGTDRIIRNDGGSFIADGFQTGDSIILDSPLNPMVIASITSMSFSTLYVSGAGITEEVAGTALTVYGTRSVLNLDYYYGIVENNALTTTNSLIDNSPQKYKSGSIYHLNVTPSPLLPDTNVNSWAYDITDQNSTIEGVGLVGINQQRFKIVHEFYIQPVFVAGDLQSTNNLVAPNYLANTASLRYIPRIDCRYTQTGTNVDKSTSNGNVFQFIKSGDVGWFDEVGDGATAGYTLDSIFYKDTLTNAITTSILPNTETDVIININSLDSKFSKFNSEFIVHVYRTPTDATVYQNTTTDIKENFLVSRQKLTFGAAPTPTDEGFIKAGAVASFTAIDSATIEFTFSPTFFLSQDQVLNDLSAFNNDPANVADGYLIFVTCQDYLVVNKGDSDKVAVLVDVNTAVGISADDFYNTDGVCSANTLFLDHPNNNNNSLAFTDYKGWLEDSVVTRSNIQVLKQNEQQGIGSNIITNNWSLTDLTIKVEAENILDVTKIFTLEERTFLPDVYESEARDFILPNGTPQNQIIWSEGLETATHKQYDLQYPFKIRWEDWKVLYGADIDFPNATQDWVSYITSQWNVKVNLYKTLNLDQDLQGGVSACKFTFNVSGKDIKIGVFTVLTGNVPLWNDSLNNVTQASNTFNYSIPNDVNRDITVSLANCLADVESIRMSTEDNKVQGFLDLSTLVNLDSLYLNGQSGITSLLLPNSGGSAILINGNSDLFTADLSGFTNLDSSAGGGNWVNIRWNFNLDSIILPTVPVAPTFSFVLLHDNALTSLDLTPIIQSLAATPKIDARKNKLSSADIDQIIIDVDSQSVTDGELILTLQSPLAPPTPASAAALLSLGVKNWTVTTD